MDVGIDLDDYINKLHRQIEDLQKINASLRREIRTQRYEIAELRQQRTFIIEDDTKPPEYYKGLWEDAED
jgi:predicted RNase H-like nuclease (RuvC/YqgF family)